MTVRITLEIVPFGQEHKKYRIHVVDVNNMLEYLSNGKCLYRVVHQNITRNEGGLLDLPIAHLRRDGPLKLAALALLALIKGGEGDEFQHYPPHTGASATPTDRGATDPGSTAGPQPVQQTLLGSGVTTYRYIA